jgi:hypothetical protein
LAEFGAEIADAVAAGALVEGAVLERGMVAVDRGFRRGDLAGDRVEFGGVLLIAVGAKFLFGGDGGGDQVGAGVEVEQGVGGAVSR